MFFSQAKSGRAREKLVYERELMAIVLVVKKWWHYLSGQRGDIRPETLKHLLERREIQLEYKKWLTKLLGYDFEIKYHSGLLNKAADALSRVPYEAELLSISVLMVIDLEYVQKEVENDPELRKIEEETEVDPL